MKTKNKEMMEALNLKEQKDVMGGYVQPTKEQLDEIRKNHGPFAEYLIFW